MDVVLKTEFKDLKLLGRGKVRDIYEVEGNLLIVTTDRISAFDVILPNGIPYKGYVLNQLSKFWFELMSDIVPNHIITTDVDKMPAVTHKYKKILDGRSMLTKIAKPLPVECVVRGYLAGSGWREYLKTGEICGIKLRQNLRLAEKLNEPIFTPATKEELGKHDENVDFKRVVSILGKDAADNVKKYCLEIYKKAVNIAENRGIIIADTKMEFGFYENNIILIDELITPDSSRFWYKKDYKVGVAPVSMDKQYVRDYLESLEWDKNPPAPELPQGVVVKTSEKYLEIMRQLIE
jgi:phosphoribosylaminoimidazole-succinocarboxamide synthase